jgi:hypothetical protein
MISILKLILEEKYTVRRRSDQERVEKYVQGIQKKIQDYIRNGSEGDLDFTDSPITSLPDNLKIVRGNLILESCKELTHLPPGLVVEKNLELSYSGIQELPQGLHVKKNLTLEYCTDFVYIPPDLEINGDFKVVECTIKEFPQRLKIGGSLRLVDWPNLTHLVPDLHINGVLRLDFCNIKELPRGLKVEKDLFLRHTPISNEYTQIEIQEMIIEKGGFIGGEIILRY